MVAHTAKAVVYPNIAARAGAAVTMNGSSGVTPFSGNARVGGQQTIRASEVGKAPKGGKHEAPKAANDVAPIAVPKARHNHHALDKAQHTALGVGETAFNLTFFPGIIGFFARNTIGRLSTSIRNGIGMLSYAPWHALNDMSWGQLLGKGGVDAFKGNYFGYAHKYSTGAPYRLVSESRFPIPIPWAKDKPLFEGSKGLKALADKYGGIRSIQKTAVAGTGIAKYLGKLKNASILPSLVLGGFAAGSALLAARFAVGTVDALSDAAEVASDLEGRVVTRNDILRHSDKLSPMTRELVANLRAVMMPEGTAKVGEIATNMSFATMGSGLAGHAAQAASSSFMGGATMPLMIGGMMLSQAGNALMPSQHFIKSYLAIKDLQKAGDAVAPQYYAELMEAASAEVRMAGGMESRQVQRLAEKCAEEGITAKALVKEIEAKEPFQKRAEAVAKEIEAEDKAANVAPAHNNPIPTAKDKAAQMTEAPKRVALEKVAHDGMLEAAKKSELGAPA